MQIYKFIELLTPDLLQKFSNCKYSDITQSKSIPWESFSPGRHSSDYEACFVKEGDAILNLSITMPDQEAGYGTSYSILSPHNGICTIRRESHSYKPDVFTIYFFKDLKEFGEFFVDSYYRSEIKTDIFEDKKIITWKSKGLNDDFLWYCDGIGLCSSIYIYWFFGVEADTTGVFFKFVWSKEWRKMNEMGIGDTLTILFEDKEKISFTAKSKPIKTSSNSDYYRYLFSINRSQLNKFATTHIVAWKMDFANGDPSYSTNPLQCRLYNATIFCTWVRKNIELFAECGFEPAESAQKEEIKINEACYVYLMHDEANGFYKIGISNKPEYREHTLQSEKPTISLVQAKQFPIRTIAEAFEAALHKTYEAKRIRGEWFRLDSTDVENLRIALS